MEKTATITRTVFKNEWTGQNGKVFYHEIELDNGDKGQIGCKDKDPEKLNPGKQLTYTIEKTEKGTKIKAANANPGGGGYNKPKQQSSPSSFALSYAKDVVIASWGEHAPKKMQSDDLFAIADKMYTWMKERA
jgi:hypothetical protein